MIEQIKTERQECPVEGDVATVMSEYLNAMEDRILALETEIVSRDRAALEEKNDDD